MYTVENGIKVPINMGMADGGRGGGDLAGENKDVLYASLTLGVLVLLLAIYLLYRYYTIKKSEKFGYNLLSNNQ